ncbi:MAG: 50S ribosomal protein L19e [Candidatus Geothermarchaeales archaeon]
MTNLRLKRKLAARVFGVGLHRVWFDPDSLDELEGVDTREDVRALEARGFIKVLAKKGQTRSTRGRKGPGRRKGKKTARMPKKERWMQRVRAQRKLVRELRERDEITPSQYRHLYRLIGGGKFRSKARLREHVARVLKTQSA